MKRTVVRSRSAVLPIAESRAAEVRGKVKNLL